MAVWTYLHRNPQRYLNTKLMIHFYNVKQSFYLTSYGAICLKILLDLLWKININFVLDIIAIMSSVMPVLCIASNVMPLTMMLSIWLVWIIQPYILTKKSLPWRRFHCLWLLLLSLVKLIMNNHSNKLVIKQWILLKMTLSDGSMSSGFTT